MLEKINSSVREDAPGKGCGPLLRSAPEAASPLRQQIFEYIRSQGAAARSDITGALSISPGSATTLTADLIACGHLREIEHLPRESGRGRPKVALEVVSEAAHVIGLKLGFDGHTGVLADFAGNVVADAVVSSGTGQMTVARIADETCDLFDTLLGASGLARSDIAALGVGLPGLIDHDTGKVVWSPLLRTKGEDLSAILSMRLGVHVLLDNDTNMLTLAELWFGEGRRIRDFAAVTVESGVGMGLVLGNQLYRGAHGMGLELGHTKVQVDGALCRCGQRGCLEAYLADYALVREATTALGRAVDPALSKGAVLAQLFEEAGSGHPAAENIFRRAGQYLAVGLSNVVQLFDPELIILSGARMQYDYLYAEEVIETLNRLTLHNGRKACRVVINKWDDLVWARGASALALTAATPRVISDTRPT